MSEVRSILPSSFARGFLRTGIIAIAGTTFAARTLSPALTVVSTTVVSTHEFGHWTAAWLHRAQPSPPLILPAGVMTVGVTRVKRFAQVGKRLQRRIVACGPLAGIGTILALVPVALTIPGLWWALAGAALYEVYNGLLGSDGRRLRYG